MSSADSHSHQVDPMNKYWWLLSGLVTDLTIALDINDLTPEEFLAEIRRMRDVAKYHTQELPPSIRAELDSNQQLQEAIAYVSRPDAVFYQIDDNGNVIGKFRKDGTELPLEPEER